MLQFAVYKIGLGQECKCNVFLGSGPRVVVRKSGTKTGKTPGFNAAGSDGGWLWLGRLCGV